MSEVAAASGLHELLCGAIRNKRLVRFRYKDKERIVEPHDYGVQKGIARLLSWQVGGQSSGRIPGWRWFDVSDIQACEMLETSFAGNRDVSGKHHQWDEVFIRVEPPPRSDGKE
jgi:predicted DNA-binding transcriptional regulator YafY